LNHQKTLKTALCTALIAAFALGLCAPAFAADVWTLSATPSSSSVAQGALVTISGTLTLNGAAASGVFVSVQITDTAGNLAYSTIVTTATDGTYSAQYRIAPNGATGTYSVAITASQGGAQVAATVATFAVTPATTLTLTPIWAAPGATVAYAGTGFTASRAFNVSLTWTGIAVQLSSGTSNASGAVSGTFKAPAIASAVYTVTLNDSTGLLGTASFGVGQTPLDLSQVLTTLNAIGTNVTTLQNALNTVGTNVVAVQTLLTTVSGTVNTINGNTATLSTSIGAVSTAVSNLGASISSINSGLAQVQTAVGALSTPLANLDAKIVALNGTVATISTSVGTVSTDLAAINAKVTSNGNGIATIQTTLGTIQGDMAKTGDIATITTSLGTISAKIDTVQSDVTSTKDTTSGLSTLIIVAIVLALVAAIAAIASIVLMRRKIAG